jgi:hypothetical protein
VQPLSVYVSQSAFDNKLVHLRFHLHEKDIDAKSLPHWLKQRYLTYHVLAVQRVQDRQVTLRIEGKKEGTGFANGN